MTPGSLLRDARARHRLSQQALAGRARTTQKQVSRIENDEISPSVRTLERLLAVMGERLEIRAVAGPRDNRSDAEVLADAQALTGSERVAAAAALSHTLTAVAAGRVHRT